MELSDLNPAQIAAVEHDKGPILVVAGAGTGKTQVITRRIAHLISKSKAQAHEILALTFTEKAAREMEERVDLLLPYGTVDTQIMTFHAFGDSLLKEFALDIGLSPTMQVMSKSQQIVFLKDHFDELDLNYFAPVGSPDKYLDALVVFFSRLKEELISPESYMATAKKMSAAANDDAEKAEATKHEELAGAYQKYVHLTKEAGFIDFSDQISLAIELFSRRPNVLATLKARFKYILVDEFQDTNLAQNRLLELLAGTDGNIMVVGDDDQSIYKFRGAAVSNILQFKEHFPRVEQVVLTENYRSTQEVLDSAYRLIQNNNPDRLEFKNKIIKYLTAHANGPMPQVITAPTYSLEADAVAIDIRERIKKGEQAGDMAILIRKRSQAEPIIQALSAQNIPYRLSGKQSLYRQPEVQLIFDFLNYLVTPTDSMSLYHLLASEIYGAELKILMMVAATARRQNKSLENVLFNETSGDSAFDEQILSFARQVERWRRLSIEYTVGQLVFDFLQVTGYLDRLTEESKANPAIEAKIRNLSRFFSLLTDFESVAEDKSALAYTLAAEALKAAGDDPDSGEADVSEDEVQIMTIHKAKGLEFNTVYIFDLTKGAFPGNRRRETLEIPLEMLAAEVTGEGDWHMQEERRLMYVAMTRAKQNLIMSWSPDHGGVQQKKPSPFITEALGVEIPKLETDKSLLPLQQIQLFEVKAKESLNLKPRFMQGDKLFLTPHQIDDYLSCPENFRYLYILEVPQPPAPALMYGSLVHAIINQYYIQKKQGRADTEQLMAMVPALWRSDGFISKGQEKRRYQQVQETVKRVIEREEARNEQPLYTEKEFQVEIPEHNVVIRGRFDAVFTNNQNEVEIRDFKTSMVEDSSKADDKAKASVQLAIYALAWQRMTGKAPNRVVLDYVETGQVGVATKTEADIQKTVDQIGQVAEGIRSGIFTPGKSCFYCSHRVVDPTQQSAKA